MLMCVAMIMMMMCVCVCVCVCTCAFGTSGKVVDVCIKPCTHMHTHSNLLDAGLHQVKKCGQRY